MRLTDPPKKTRQTAPLSERDSTRRLFCCWCEKNTYSTGSQPCWSDILQGTLCRQCSMQLTVSGHLSISPAQISSLDIFCGSCGSLRGPLWTLRVGVPACSPQCAARIRSNAGALTHQKANPQTAEGDRFQDQNQKKLTMTAPVRNYFKEIFGLDTTKEGLRAMMAGNGH